MAFGQVWATDSLGGYLNTPELSAKLRHAAQPLSRFRQFCSFKEEYGKKRDELFIFDKVGNVSTAAITTGLVEDDVMPETDVTIYQSTGTLTEYGNAIPHSFKLEAFSKWNPKNPIQKALRDDMVKTIDKVVEAQFDACKIRAVYVTDVTTVTITTNGTATATNSVLLDDYCLKEIVDYLEGTMYAKTYNSDGYMGIAPVKAIRGLHDHLQAIWQYTKYPVNGEVGKYYNTRIVKETNDAMSTTMGNGSVFPEAYFFGDETVIEAVSVPEEIRMKIPTDYGRSMGVAWYFIGGFQIIWSGDPSNTIVKLDSA